MNRRLKLHELLKTVSGTPNVYFQPPESLKLKYPAIIYALNGINSIYADDKPYIAKRAYSITVIDKNPDSAIADRISELPECRFNRAYASDNLNHTVFTITY